MCTVGQSLSPKCPRDFVLARNFEEHNLNLRDTFNSQLCSNNERCPSKSPLSRCADVARDNIHASDSTCTSFQETKECSTCKDKDNCTMAACWNSTLFCGNTSVPSQYVELEDFMCAAKTKPETRSADEEQSVTECGAEM